MILCIWKHSWGGERAWPVALSPLKFGEQKTGKEGKTKITKMENGCFVARIAIFCLTHFSFIKTRALDFLGNAFYRGCLGKPQKSSRALVEGPLKKELIFSAFLIRSIPEYVCTNFINPT